MWTAPLRPKRIEQGRQTSLDGRSKLSENQSINLNGQRRLIAWLTGESPTASQSSRSAVAAIREIGNCEHAIRVHDELPSLQVSAVHCAVLTTRFPGDATGGPAAVKLSGISVFLAVGAGQLHCSRSSRGAGASALKIVVLQLACQHFEALRKRTRTSRVVQVTQQLFRASSFSELPPYCTTLHRVCAVSRHPAVESKVQQTSGL